MGTTSLHAVRSWLWFVFGTIVTMTLIGGTTRLTGSGLSMVEWHPLMGVLPPIGDAAWDEVFALYKTSPQYEQVNSWMTLADFKLIFFWEYLHRVFGRVIGLVVLGPWLVFLVRRKLQGMLALKTLMLMVLGGLQGLLGWYMVKSGLVDRPEVSHFRLAAHLLLAFTVAQYTAWLALGLQTAPARVQRASRATRAAALALTPLLVLQIIYGAFVAGTRAGLYSATFPDVNGMYLPGAFVGAEGALQSLLHGVPLIHWTHRFLGWLVFFGLLGLGWRLRAESLPWLRRPAALLVGLVSLQFLLGALTVVFGVPTGIAVAHQGVALLLLTCLTWVLHRCFFGGPAASAPTS